jgi:hypothetical protein
MVSVLTLCDEGIGSVLCPPRDARIPAAMCATCQWFLGARWQDGIATIRCAPPPPVRQTLGSGAPGGAGIPRG